MRGSESAVNLSELCRLAIRAGQAAMQWYKRDNITVTSKQDFSPVTAADLAAHKVLIDGLPHLLPGVPVVSEEGDTDSRQKILTVMTEDTYWLVDPLDGTRDFLAQTDDFTVNIALMVEGVPKVGCVVAPARSQAYVADLGLGAFQVSGDGQNLQTIRVRKADPSQLVFLVSRSHLHGEDGLIQGSHQNAQIRRVGSALKYALIAAGHADISVRNSPTSLWDTAAAQCLLEAAGGMMLQFDGSPMTYRTGRLINPPFIAVGDLSIDWRKVAALFTDR
ncbi:MAG: 3'(2'),5'-bisphosphate nucleotidase CysQ [Deltaproteobacteria bacterium]|nr:3'(2'),5'-bisphosphate nucleotidase CysQ [Deltaproteobacteria bacterium]